MANTFEKLKIPQIQSLFLVITRKCNLNCVYCFYNNIRSQSLFDETISMDEGVAKKAIDTFSELMKNNKVTTDYWQSVTFYGGEPLFNLPIINLAIDYIRELQKKGGLGKKVGLVVNTNGTLINEEFIKLALNENIEVQISIDGFKKTHDSCRITKDGKGSFDKVIYNIKKMAKLGVNVVPMITITENNINELPKFVEWLCVNIKIKRYGMNILMATTGNCKLDYPSRAAKAMWLANTMSLQYGVSDIVFVSQIERFSGPDICYAECGATGRKIAVFPKGEVHTCQALEKAKISFMGDLSTIKEDNEVLQVWRSRSKFKNINCLKCPILGSCNNGCAAGAFHFHGDIMANDPNHCQWIKSLFNIWMLNK